MEKDDRTHAQRLQDGVDRMGGVVRTDLVAAYLTSAVTSATNALVNKGADQRESDHWRGKIAAHRELLNLLTTPRATENT
jgi:hypothetical protein